MKTVTQKKLLYLPYIRLETVFSSAQITSTFEKSDLYCHRLFSGFIQLPIHLVIILLLMLLGTLSGLSLLALLHILYILQKNDGRCRWVECNPRILLICYKCSRSLFNARWMLKITWNRAIILQHFERSFWNFLNFVKNWAHAYRDV